MFSRWAAEMPAAEAYTKGVDMSSLNHPDYHSKKAIKTIQE
jgi:hypothetical protein